jgi:serine/threonine-protein kinase
MSRLHLQAPVLAALAHPNVARTLDLAVDGDPAPYVATEYVRGSPITGYCDRLQIPRAGRLELLATLAAILRCAHQHGVVHGGIKPSNVLVSGRAAAASITVTDFGLRHGDEQADGLAVTALAGSLLGPSAGGKAGGR